MIYSKENVVPSGATCYVGAACIYRPELIRELLAAKGKKKLEDFLVTGTLTKPLAEIFAFLESKGGKCVMSLNKGDYVYKWKEGYIYVDHRPKSNLVNISGESLDPKLISLGPILEKDFLSKVKKNLIFTIMESSSGLTIESLGDGSSPLIKDNYDPQVITDIDFVIESFKKNPPNGRICIINGEPGTGKTHLIRSLLEELDNIFLIVSSNVISSLEKPSFMPLFLKIRNDYQKPIIMIVEDGDTCLVPRKSDNISTIAALLNLSDGILGSLIDIKMVISTNANIKDMDAAIMRPGRLCRRIHVCALETAQANRVYQRLLKDDKGTLEYRKDGYTLAEIYHRANFTGAPTIGEVDNERSSNRRVIGFHRASNTDLTLNKG